MRFIGYNLAPIMMMQKNIKLLFGAVGMSLQ